MDSLDHPPTQHPPSTGEGKNSFKPSTTDPSNDVSEEESTVLDKDDLSVEPSPFITPKGTTEGVVNVDGETLILSEEEDDKEGEDKGEQSGH